MGVPVSAHKLEGPANTLTFLGILLDTLKLEIRLPDDKLSRLRASFDPGDKKVLHKETAVIPNWTAPARMPSGSARPLLLEEDDYTVNNSKGTASPYPLKCWVPIGPTVVVCLLSRLEWPTNAGMHIKRAVRDLQHETTL